MRNIRARRALSTTAIVAALGLTLAACGGDDETVDPSDPPSEPSTSEQQDAPESSSEDDAADPEAPSAGVDDDTDSVVPGGEAPSGGESTGSGGDTAGPGEYEAPAEGEPITEIPSDAAVNLAYMVPEGDSSLAEVFVLVGDTLNYLYGDTGQPEADLEESIQLEPGTGDETRAQLLELGLTASEGAGGPPQTVDEETIYWEIGAAASTDGAIAASTGDAEIDAAVYDILIELVPEDIRVS